MPFHPKIQNKAKLPEKCNRPLIQSLPSKNRSNYSRFSLTKSLKSILRNSQIEMPVIKIRQTCIWANKKATGPKPDG